MHGNKKENIFLALDGKNQYIAHSYIWAYENHHSCYEKPRDIFICLDIPQANEYQPDATRELLFKSALERAYTLKNELWKGQNTRIYGGGTVEQKDILAFLIKQGFVNDDAVFIMKAKVDDEYFETINNNYEIKKCKFTSVMEIEAFIERHNNIFPIMIDKNKLEFFKEHNNLVLFSVFYEGRIVGECMAFEKDKSGYIEIFYVLPEFRGTGIADTLIKQVFSYLFECGYREAGLNVWERNKRAIRFYSKNGFDDL